ncbi:hypothetical protein J2744_001813 [Halorubrum trapanicum]|uniref:Uncharacterized protein n=1 Tax=Halorubrum trapanicum TaxID=29284 RepID=A0A8J7R8C8_9EURY|nr:hypothetical protein [Halorubrum trapanicum]MBP1902129.1 hypothetical protein [Halorubrum trapanicum]
MDQSALEQIKQYQQEVEEHHRAATYEIWAYYHEPEVSKYESSPHDQQFKQAAAYIDMAITKVGAPGDEWKDRDVSIDWLSRRDWSRHMAADLFYGVALELIVSAVHLKLDPRDYLTYMSIEGGKTPYINDSEEILKGDLRRDISEDHVDEIEGTLKLVRKKRNNLAHLGHHYQGSPNYSILFVTVAGYLIDRYADTTVIPELETMADYLDQLEQDKSDSEIYPELSVDFRPVSSD